MSSNLPGIPPQVPLPPLPQSHYAQHLPHPQPPQSPPILSSTSSSSQIQFGSDIHARLVAFQQKRSRPLNNPSSFDFPQYSSTVSNNSSNNNFNSGNISSTSSSNDEDVSRKSSRRRPNFKLDLESDGSLSRGNSVNRNIDTNTPPATIYDSDTSNNPNHSATESEYDSDMEPQRPNGLFENYKKYIDIKSGRLNFSGKASLHSKGIDFSSGSSFRISLDELEYIDELGRGNYGSVSKVLHKPTGVLMAMKEVRLELDENKFTQILMELDILHKCDSPYIVDFYGAFFVEGAVYMCIEYMDGGSLDKVYGKDHGIKDETSLAYITECVIRGLKELKDKHNIIHRDVKPTNILCNTQGKIKLCDFGVSGNLVSSLAKTNIGCQSYMAPERIKTLNPNDATYSVQSDIWSLGLTILEIAEGQYPYPSETYDNIFSQLSAIVDGEPPKLNPTIFSKEAQIFVKSCLNKNPDLRPSYSALLNNNWLVKYRGVDPHLDISLSKRVEELNEEKLIKKNLINKKASATAAAIQNPSNIETVQSLLRSKVKAPALHRGGLPSNKSFLNHR
ncbi:kinase-like domain-containing protein [Scheffersomyces coipomensis]|uniref:kinase-like domain-containing protein n=1 Tax=Scheffersomyces coipomensis TaxID=1788519 RepID=UPI00315C658F